MRAASADISSLELVEPAPCLIEDESETPDVPMPAPERFRVTGRGMFPSLGLPAGLPLAPPWVDENEGDRPWDDAPVAEGWGITNRSATERGGERGSDVRRGRLPGDPEMLSRCWFLMSVGVKSGPSSRERKREERRDSSVSSWKLGDVRYVTETANSPIGWVMGGNACLSCCNTGASAGGAVSGYHKYMGDHR